MSVTGIAIDADPLAVAARALWAAVEAIEALGEDDLRGGGVQSVAEAAWRLADELETRIERASQG